MLALNDSKNLSNLSNSMIEINEMPIDIIMYGTISYLLIFIIGVIGNLLVIIVTLKEKQLRNFTNYLLANLSIADLLVLLTNVPTGLHDLFAKERWYLGKALCYLISFFENCMGNASLLTIFFITCERFYVICRPLNVRSLMTKSRILRIIICIWIISILINLPFIFMSEYRFYKFYDGTSGYKCYLKATNISAHIYSITVSYVIYFVIGIILLHMCYKISSKLKKSNSYLNSLKSEMVTSTRKMSFKGNVLSLYKLDETFQQINLKLKTNTLSNTRLNPNKNLKMELVSVTKFNSSFEDYRYKNSNSIGKHIRKRTQIIRLLICIIIVFYFCLFPLKIWNLLLMFLSHKKGFIQIITLKDYWYINITVRIFFYIHSSINPILYNFLSADFRTSLKRTIFM